MSVIAIAGRTVGAIVAVAACLSRRAVSQRTLTLGDHGRQVMRKRVLIAALVSCVLAVEAVVAGDLAMDFVGPPDSAKPRVYWWWLNSRVSKEGITRDLEQYRAKGIGGVLLFDAGMPAGPMPSGPRFMSPEWLDMVKHALLEADRLGIEVSINLCSGWDAGGPWITPEFAAKPVVTSEPGLKGPHR